MRRRHVRGVAAAASAVLVGALAAACTGSSSGDDGEGSAPSSPSASASGAASPSGLRLTRLPPIAQSGATSAPADDARPVVSASVRPRRAGVRVTLQRHGDSGWKAVGTSVTDGFGLASFTPPGSSQAVAAAHYRAVATSRRTTPKRTSSGTDGGDWRVAFDDEFDGASLDDRWTYRNLGVFSKESGRRVSASSEAAVDVQDGVVDLQVKQDPRRAGRYLNGHISTESTFSFRYGVAAARIRFQQPRGVHAAFWSQSHTVNAFPGDPKRSGAEIDIGEYFGDGYPRGGLASYVYHYDKAGKNVKDGDVVPRAVDAVGSPEAFWRTFHVYSVQWSPEGYVFRIDGRTTFATDRAVSGADQFLVLSLLSSDWELPDLDRSLLPATMSVDWVRVWQR